MTAQRIGRIAPMIICIMIIYALWNIAGVRRDLMRAEEYRLELIQQTQAVAAENERLEREIAQATSKDSSVFSPASHWSRISCAFWRQASHSASE